MISLSQILLIHPVINYVNSYDFSTLWHVRRAIKKLNAVKQSSKDIRRFQTTSFTFFPTKIVNCQVFEKRRTAWKRVLTRFHV